MKKSLFVLMVSALLASLPAPAVRGEAIDPALRSALQSLAPDGELPVIVTLADRVDVDLYQGGDRKARRTELVRALKEKADATQKPLRAFLAEKGARRIVPLWIANGLAVSARADVIEELSRRPGVESVRLDATVAAPVETFGTAALPEWNLAMVHAPELWSLGYTGGGVVVAGMDTGVDPHHPDLAGRWRGGANSWFDPHGQHATPHDASGHGTQTMGIMVGGDAGVSAIGVAPGARWIAAKIFNDAGTATLSAIHQGFQWLLDPDGNPATDDAPDVVNNSWGFDGNAGGCIPEFESDVHTLKAAGIAVVFSAGNAGPGSATSVSPANYPESFAVGAVDGTGTIAYTGSRGPSACDGSVYPETVAPGVNVRTADLTFGGVIPNSYATVAGTSYAAPHVSGTMALLLSAFPGLSVAELESALKQSAADLGTAGPDNAYGYGLIDAVAAYSALGAANGAPVAADDAYTFIEDGGALGVAVPGLLANDTDPDGDPLTAQLVAGPAGGTVTLNPNGSFSYTPKPNFSGGDTFTYRASDGSLQSNAATVRISVTPVNDPPTAVNDSAATSRNIAVTINVIANDTDPDGTVNPASVAIVTGPARGKVTNNLNGTVRYTPNKNIRGTDSFIYTVKDNGGAVSNAATVTVTVR